MQFWHKRSVPHNVLAVKGGDGVVDTHTSTLRVRVDMPTITIFGDGEEARAVVYARRERCVVQTVPPGEYGNHHRSHHRC